MTRAALLLATIAVVACGPPIKPTGTSPTTSTGTVIVSGPALATVAPDTQPILDDWANAMGGRDAIAALGELHAKGTYEKGGMMGTIETWISTRGERREEITLGPLREIRVFDGKQGWLVDRNREVRDLAGFELDDQRALAFRQSWAPLLLDRFAGTVSREGDGLVLTPAGGKRPETVTFDRGTKLPVSFVRRDGERMRTTRYADWNTVEGIKLPFTMREETGNPNDNVTIHWTRLERASSNASRYTRPADREPDWSLATDPAVVPIEVVYGGLIFVKVSINDQPMSFIFDTGAEFTLLNSSRVSKLGLQGVGTFATGAGGGDVVVSFVPGVTTKLGGATVSGQIIGAILLDALEKPLGRPLDGILGYDFISRFVVEIDYKNQRMRLMDRTKYVHIGSAKPTPITLEDSTPYFNAAIEVPSVGDVGGNFVLDTGCLCEVQLFTPFVDQHKLLTAFPHAKQAGYAAGAGGTTNQMTAKIPAVKVAGYMIKDPQAEFSRDKHGATADPETAGLIGSLVFKKFLLVLDYKKQQVYFEPLKN
jgi:predicted aspartyl protease